MPIVVRIVESPKLLYERLSCVMLGVVANEIHVRLLCERSSIVREENQEIVTFLWQTRQVRQLKP